MLGDVNGDNVIDIEDAVAIIQHINGVSISVIQHFRVCSEGAVAVYIAYQRNSVVDIYIVVF